MGSFPGRGVALDVVQCPENRTQSGGTPTRPDNVHLKTGVQYAQNHVQRIARGHPVTVFRGPGGGGGDWGTLQSATARSRHRQLTVIWAAARGVSQVSPRCAGLSSPSARPFSSRRALFSTRPFRRNFSMMVRTAVIMHPPHTVFACSGNAPSLRNVHAGVRACV